MVEFSEAKTLGVTMFPATPTVQIFSEPSAVAARLAEMQLDEQIFVDAFTQANMYRVRLTLHHPRLYRYVVMTQETIAALRDILIPRKWEKKADGNYELVVNRGLGIAIAVASGNSGTGNNNITPSNKSRKGCWTIQAIDDNLTADFFPETLPKQLEEEKLSTWILLFNLEKDVIHAELSRPNAYDDTRQYVVSWSERIILGSLDLYGEDIPLPISNLPDIDIDITFKEA